ncbi:SLATT domain-containing protein [Shewanella carassii]|uniref:SLATT domain-containing protein n=1 Tax=Shewanella carassii TaxID=1987584 RepID=A0ABQ1TG64_9GAMM|nr:SLATT domain-containing protein [Shewanella carassii]GGE94564.1 hypothetical protein GCM10011520_38620 [Shewanella carassii]
MNEELLKEYQSETNRIEEDAIHSAKAHYNAAERWSHINLFIGIPNAVLAAFAGVEAFKGSEVLAGSLAIAVAAITAISTFLNPGDRASNHKRCAGEYLALKNRSRIFNKIDCERIESEDKLDAIFKELVDKRDNLNSTSPQIPSWAFKKAKKGIDAGEADYKEK